MDTNFGIGYGLYAYSVKTDDLEKFFNVLVSLGLSADVEELVDEPQMIDGHPLGCLRIAVYPDEYGEEATFQIFDKKSERSFMTQPGPVIVEPLSAGAQDPVEQVKGGLPTEPQDTTLLATLQTELRAAGFDVSDINWYSYGHMPY